jgi:hypothetical protein
MKISKSEAKAFKNRWERVNAAQRHELRQTSLLKKILHLAALMASVKAMRWDKALSKEVTSVRNRWKRLRKAYHAE